VKNKYSKLLTGVAIAVLMVLVAIQWVPIDRTNPPAKLEIAAPANVRAVLERSCFDCHSNRTKWPWYSRVAPASWFVIRHVDDARKDLNMTEWPMFDVQAQLFYLGEMKKQIADENMPLASYLLLHRDAKLSDADRELLLTWIDEEVGLLSAPSWP